MRERARKPMTRCHVAWARGRTPAGGAAAPPALQARCQACVVAESLACCGVGGGGMCHGQEHQQERCPELCRVHGRLCATRGHILAGSSNVMLQCTGADTASAGGGVDRVLEGGAGGGGRERGGQGMGKCRRGGLERDAERPEARVGQRSRPGTQACHRCGAMLPGRPRSGGASSARLEGRDLVLGLGCCLLRCR
jgi:hypothetical protein